MSAKNLHKRYSVYRIRFSTGEVYVGHTRRPIGVRLASHRQRAGGDNPVNARLAEAFRGEEKHGRAKIEALSTHATHEEAVAAEQREIDAAKIEFGVQRVLNEAHAQNDIAHRGDRTSKYCAARTEGLYRCSWCRRDLSPSEYWRDSCRWNGLMSRCKDCCRAYKSTGGKSAAECYRCVKEERREWGRSLAKEAA